MAELKRQKRGKGAAANDPDADVQDDTTTETKPDAGIDRLIERATAAGFDTDRLIGSVADFLVADLRATHELKPWSKLLAEQQEALIERANKQARGIVAQVVAGIAARGLESMEGVLEDSGAFKDGHFILKIAVPMNADTARLLSSRGGIVQMVFANAAEFESVALIGADPDQPSLPGTVKAAGGEQADEQKPAGGEGDEQPNPPEGDQPDQVVTPPGKTGEPPQESARTM